ncbi:hypothetical protein BDA96_08G087800 [Sorghum bicolor]|uniref:Uncharacterized protein n=2 Tax=Sorghum bicolor TaxID=4558 RepID=C5YTX8_SORBI|nr:uncharacterized protein LOC8058180 [Sorghum bicolor]XP_021321908.1 uncharacterized protein LOC8058180 [Sorghum bicolor]EES15878.1 hypothetical protein SORBI_3008G081800 [Sorghum bicolor]KAG0520595.1 hypothetical protein BDA96_08G087800 [Sorghum bicolor]|eukprot:XP_002442040.1 uncharacterized protein LOC8058180 [Sorghum bicolor]
MGTNDFDGSELDNKTTSLHDQFSTQLSLSSSNDSEEIATSSCPDKECPLAILNLSLKSFKQVATEEDAVKWSLEENGLPFVLSDSEWGDSSYASSLSEQSSTISTPSTPFTVQSDTQSEDLDRTDIWVSSLDLEAEDSALLPDKEQLPDVLGFDFPSPSFSSIRSLQFGPSSYSTGTLQGKEANDSDEPIFWPFECTSYNSPEFDKFLSVSPRRNTTDLRYAEVRHLNPILQRLRKNTLSSVKKCIEPRQRTSNSDPKGSTASSQEKIQKTPAVPSRLSRTTKASVPSSHHQKRRPPHLKLGGPRKVSTPQLQADHHSTKKNEASDVQKLADKKSRIEELIGLDEFDGHEGMGSDSSDHQFNLWISPR